MLRPLRSREVIAHRGASAAAPEHTGDAYDLAVAQGADRLELDIRASGDGELLVIHDPTLARTTGDPRRVDLMTRATLAELPSPVRPLTLDAVLERYGQDVRLLIELKDPRPDWEGLVVEAVERHGLEERVMLQTFDLVALRRLRLRAAHLPLSSLHVRRPSGRTLDRVARCAAAIGVWHRRVDPALVAAAHGRGLKVNAWTANAPADIARVQACGVDGVITDVPDLAGSLLQAETLSAAA